jgi:hypothetical protein
LAVLAQRVEKKGTFKITGTVDKNWPNEIIGDYQEHGDIPDEELNLSPEQQADLDKFKQYIDPEFDWESVLDMIPRKANGTFAKNRVTVLAEGHAFRWVCEESYGERGPQLSLKSISDTEAELRFDWGAVIYKY